MSKARALRANPLKTPRWRARRRLGSGISLRQAAQAAVLIAPFLLMILIGTGYLFPSAPRQMQPPNPSAENYRNRIGQILFTPTNGSATICEERLFDNLTGALVADGFIDCTFKQEAELPSSMRQEKSADRMRAVFEAFKR